MFTDGACRGNPGPGGWGVLLRMGDKERELAGGEPLTTNNRMELLAAIRGLEALKRPCRVRLHTDSIYVRDGITRWVHNWQRNGWRTSDKKPVKNAELWQELITASAPEVLVTEVIGALRQRFAVTIEEAAHVSEGMTFKLPRELVA